MCRNPLLREDIPLARSVNLQPGGLRAVCWFGTLVALQRLHGLIQPAEGSVLQQPETAVCVAGSGGATEVTRSRVKHESPRVKTASCSAQQANDVINYYYQHTHTPFPV